MSSSPRSGPSQTALFALVVGGLLILAVIIALILGVNVIQYGETFVTGLYPPIAVTEQGAKVRDLYTIVFVIAVAIFLVVEGLIIWTVIRYRRKPGDVTLPPQTHGNNIAEFVWTLVPTLIVIFLFVISWQTLNVVDTNTAPTSRIRAVAGQFQWQFDYLSEDGRTILYTQLLPTASAGGGMYVPAGRTIQLSLASQDVIHAFYVPQFLFKRDVVPGRVEHVRVQGQRQRCRPDLPRPVRRAVRFRPPDHAVRRHRQDRPRVRLLAPAADRPAQRDTAARTERPAERQRWPGRERRAGRGRGRPASRADRPRTSPSIRRRITAAADKPFKIDFDNQDSGHAAQRRHP